MEILTVTHANDTPDMLFGVVSVFAFLVIAYIIGRLMGAVANVRYTRAWGPLVPVIQGTIRNDNTGAAVSSHLVGTYQNKAVEAEMTPGRNSYHVSMDGRRFNEFIIRVSGVSGDRNWRVSLQSPLASFGKLEWTLTADGVLHDKLEALDVIGTIQSMGGKWIHYIAQQNTLEYCINVSPHWAPTPKKFKSDLDTLMILVNALGEVNPSDPIAPV